MYGLPQEMEVWYIIPLLRKELANVLTKKYNFNLEETGKILGVSKSAVSQYLSGKRAAKIKFSFSSKIKKEIEKSAAVLSKNKNNGPHEIVRLLDVVRKVKDGCKICKIYNKGIISICKIKPTCRKE